MSTYIRDQRTRGKDIVLLSLPAPARRRCPNRCTCASRYQCVRREGHAGPCEWFPIHYCCPWWHGVPGLANTHFELPDHHLELPDLHPGLPTTFAAIEPLCAPWTWPESCCHCQGVAQYLCMNRPPWNAAGTCQHVTCLECAYDMDTDEAPNRKLCVHCVDFELASLRQPHSDAFNVQRYSNLSSHRLQVHAENYNYCMDLALHASVSDDNFFEPDSNQVITCGKKSKISEPLPPWRNTSTPLPPVSKRAVLKPRPRQRRRRTKGGSNGGDDSDEEEDEQENNADAFVRNDLGECYVRKRWCVPADSLCVSCEHPCCHLHWRECNGCKQIFCLWCLSRHLHCGCTPEVAGESDDEDDDPGDDKHDSDVDSDQFQNSHGNTKDEEPDLHGMNSKAFIRWRGRHNSDQLTVSNTGNPDGQQRGLKRSIDSSAQARSINTHTERVHSVMDGRCETNRKGTPLCPGFQKGTCNDTAAGARCARDWSFAHQCALCLSPTHGADICTSTDEPSPPKGKSKSNISGGKSGGKFKKGGKGRGKGW